jgi:holliday junction DNA helicase RuvA
MIASLNGKVALFLPEGIVLDVNGVGYLVQIPLPFKDRLSLGEQVYIYTYQVVRQDVLALYGFESLEGREFFHLLTTVDGVGPKLALNILSTLNPDAIRRAVFSEQAEIFTRVPGVGKRTAQKIQLYLQDKIARLEGIVAVSGYSDVDTEILDALTALGYSIVEAQAALQSIPRDTPAEVESRLRIALQYFTS